jgi:hypothetical protein
VLDTVHVFAGLAIGKQISNPLWAFAVGILSHVILDAIPHWDGGNKQTAGNEQQTTGNNQRSTARGGQVCLTPIKTNVLLIDIAVCLGLGLILSITGVLWPGFPSFQSLVSFLWPHVSLIAGVFGALLWDISLLAYLIFPYESLKRISLFSWHKKLQNYPTPAKIPSLVLQGVLVTVFILLTISN